MISTHLIDEVATVLEDIIIIKKGKILCQDSCENLLKQGYSISGPASQVDSYIEGRNTIGQDVLGGLKTAYILGTPDSEELNGLEITPLDLQKLFIQLTNV